MKYAAIAVLVFASIFAAAPVARARVADRQSVENAFQGYEVDLAPERLAALGQGWEAHVVALAASSETAPLVRARALEALSFVHTPEAAQVLRRCLTDVGGETRGAKVVEASIALVSLASSEGLAAEQTVVPFLEHPSSTLRMAAARALATMDSPLVALLLSRRLLIETHAATRAVLERVLADGVPVPLRGPVAR